MEEHAIAPAAVESVECGVYYLAPHQLIHDRAETGLQGKFSMPYCVSVALLDRTVGLAQFADERVRRADVPVDDVEGPHVRPPGADDARVLRPRGSAK